jgi:hypothetical protein
MVGAFCALALTVLVGVCASSARPLERADARWLSTPSAASRRGSVSADLPGRQEHLLGVHEHSAQGRLEQPHLARKPLPPLKRFEPRHGLAPGSAPRFVARPGTRIADEVSRSHGRIADRPVVANCPAQGPPRIA